MYGRKRKRSQPAPVVDELAAYLKQEEEPLESNPLVYWASRVSR